MKRAVRTSLNKGGFSLVEVTVAIGIFAFVAIGILGLLPAALKLRNDSAQETRAVMIAEELFACVRAAPSLEQVVVRDGPAGEERNNQSIDLTSEDVVIGYPTQTTVPYGLWGSSRAEGSGIWSSGQLPGWAVDNGIQTLARLSASPFAGLPGLYEVVCEVRTPASLPLANSKPSVFTTYAYAP
jgi:type II secretory pathway pseudopilin PulG